MPNHCMNEVVFRKPGIERMKIIEALCGDDRVNFEVLVPIPVNVWRGSVGQEHAVLGENALDWCRRNWGTKWNAYGHLPIEDTEEMLCFRFLTAWGPPYPWLVAVFNTLKRSFDHNWISEGGYRARRGFFNWEATKDYHDHPWGEVCLDATDPLQRHLHKLLWGVEELDDEDCNDKGAAVDTPSA